MRGTSEPVSPAIMLLFLYNCFCRAHIFTGAAFCAFFLIDNIGIGPFRNCIRRTFLGTGPAGNTIISNLKCHVVSPPYCNITVNGLELQNFFLFGQRQLITLFYILVRYVLNFILSLKKIIL